MSLVTKATRGSVGTNNWTNPNNATADDGVNYATCAPAAKNTSVVGDWDFAAFTDGELPVGSTINSVVIRCNYKVSTQASIASLGVQAGNNGSFDAEETHSTEPLADTDFDVTYNSAPSITDLKTAGRLVARIRGIRGNDSDAVTFSLDFVQLRVDYTEPDTTDDLTADDIATPAPTLGTPAIGQKHVLTADDVATGAPTLSSPTLSEVVALTADDIASGAPTLTSPALGQVHALTADDIAAGTPTLTEATLGQIHALTADDVTSGTPTLDSPVLTSEGDEPEPQPEPAQAFFGAVGGGGPGYRDDTVREDLMRAYEALTKAPETRHEARQIVKPYAAKPSRRQIRVDWTAFVTDLAAVQELLALYQAQLEKEARDAADEDDAEVLLLL